MDERVKRLMSVMNLEKSDPQGENFLSALEEYQALKAEIPEPDQKQVEQTHNNIVQNFLSRLECDLDSVNEQAIQRALFQLTMIAQRYGGELKSRAERLLYNNQIRQPGKPKPSRLQDFNKKIWQISSPFDPLIVEVVGELNELHQQGKELQWLGDMNDQLVGRIQGLMARAIDPQHLNTEQLHKLAVIEEVLKESKAIAPFYESRLRSAFIWVHERLQHLQEREKFSHLRFSWKEALRRKDWLEAKDFLNQTREILLIAAEQEEVQEAGSKIGGLEKLETEANTTLEDFQEDLRHFKANEISYRGKKILEYVCRLALVKAELPESLANKYRELIAELGETIKNLPGASPEGNGQGSGFFGQSKPDASLTADEIQVLLARYEKHDLRRDLQDLGESLEPWEPALAAIFKAKGEQVQKEADFWVTEGDRLMAGRITAFFEEGELTMVGPFLQEVEEYLNKRGLVAHGPDLMFVTQAAEDLAEVQSLAKHLAGFDDWQLKEEIFPLSSSLLGRYGTGSFLARLEHQRKEFSLLSDTIEKAEQALENDVATCRRLLERLPDRGTNLRLQKLRAGVLVRTLVADFQVFLDDEDFLKAKGTLDSLRAQWDAHTLGNFEEVLANRQAAIKRLEVLSRKPLEGLVVPDLLSNLQELQKLKPTLGGASLIRAQKLETTLENRITGTLDRQIDGVQAGPQKSIFQGQVKIQELLKHLENAKVFGLAIDWLYRKARGKLTHLAVQEALSRKDFKGARDILVTTPEEGVARDRQSLNRLIDLGEARHRYQTTGLRDPLLEIMKTPWYGMGDLLVQADEKTSLARDLLLEGKLSEMPAGLLAEGGLQIFRAVAEALHHGRAHYYKKLATEVAALSPHDLASALKALEVVFQDSWPPESQLRPMPAGLLFLWQKLPADLRDRLGVGDRGQILKHNLLEQLTQRWDRIHKKIRRELKIQADPPLIDYLEEIGAFLEILEDIEKLHPAIYQERFSQERREEAVKLYRQLDRLRKAQGKVQKAAEVGSWLTSQEKLDELRQAVNDLPDNIKQSGILRGQVNKFVKWKTSMDLRFSDVRACLQEGNFAKSLKHWREIKNLSNQQYFVNYLMELSRALGQEPAFNYGAPSGHSSLESFDLEAVLERLKENHDQAMAFMDVFRQATMGLNVSELKAILMDIDHAESKGRDDQVRTWRERLQSFFPPELRQLFDREFRDLTPLSAQVERILRTIKETEEFQVLQRAFAEIQKRRSQGNP